jgi:hypothetical protein
VLGERNVHRIGDRSVHGERERRRHDGDTGDGDLLEQH